MWRMWISNTVLVPLCDLKKNVIFSTLEANDAILLTKKIYFLG